jgi:hypothetical protein
MTIDENTGAHCQGPGGRGEESRAVLRGGDRVAAGTWAGTEGPRYMAVAG